jgi:LmbE family N-acetylglucosaminyl deacetylase
MKLRNATAEIWVPDGRPADEALRRTTHLAVGAHQDDIEIMAYAGVLECFARADRWFTGIVATNGAGSERSGPYAEFSDEEMRKVRRMEQRKAAFVGEYAAIAQLDYTSAEVKQPPARELVEDLKQLLRAARPRVAYTHNLADKHPTHVSTALRLLQACRELPAEERPERLLGCEVWRDLDWLMDSEKVALDVGSREALAMALVGIYDSQVTGGKRYDLATQGRRRAHATYHESHGLDRTTGLTFAMDLTPLVKDPSLDPAAYVASFVERFAADVRASLRRLGGS